MKRIPWRILFGNLRPTDRKSLVTVKGRTDRYICHRFAINFFVVNDVKFLHLYIYIYDLVSTSARENIFCVSFADLWNLCWVLEARVQIFT